ncbi:1-acyl-sn-glycerol-3-phosphate acyltransferase [Streptomyces sp. NPDC001832]|uniref:1-acyl-sn-glycerol-3-phosphate acyltransferase n=1 Tax=Streptomyces sp. NPDC001832 TaxID=3154527 RepID=UPI003319F791
MTLAAAVSPVVLAAAGLWHIPLPGRVLTREGHIPVHRHNPRAARVLQDAQAALAAGRSVLLYPEGRLPRSPAPVLPSGPLSPCALVQRPGHAPGPGRSPCTGIRQPR